jgi:chromosome segregation ATPase
LREYVIVNANESEKVKDIERNFLEKELSFKNEIENEKKNLIEAKHIIDQKDNLIFKLNNEIIDNSNLITHKDNTINNLNNQIQNYSKNIDDLQSIILSQKNEIFNQQQEITNLNNSCKNYEDIIRQKDLDMVDVKTKGKTLISQYNKKIESLNNKSQELESSMTKQKKEINDLNLLLNEIKLEKNNLEEKYYK